MAPYRRDGVGAGGRHALFVQVSDGGTWRALDLRMLLGPAGAFVLATVLFTSQYLIDDFYLVEPLRHIIYYHSRFWFIRRVRLLLERRDILGVSTESRRRRQRTTYTWEQRLVLIHVSGLIVPMGNWRRDQLRVFNQEASEIAKDLQCRWFAGPHASRLVVKVKHGFASVKHQRMRREGFLDHYLMYTASVLVVGSVFALLYFLVLAR